MDLLNATAEHRESRKVTTERGHRAAVDKQGRECVTGQEPGGRELRMGVSVSPPHSSLSAASTGFPPIVGVPWLVEALPRPLTSCSPGAQLVCVCVCPLFMTTPVVHLRDLTLVGSSAQTLLPRKVPFTGTGSGLQHLLGGHKSTHNTGHCVSAEHFLWLESRTGRRGQVSVSRGRAKLVMPTSEDAGAVGSKDRGGETGAAGMPGAGAAPGLSASPTHRGSCVPPTPASRTHILQDLQRCPAPETRSLCAI